MPSTAGVNKPRDGHGAGEVAENRNERAGGTPGTERKISFEGVKLMFSTRAENELHKDHAIIRNG